MRVVELLKEEEELGGSGFYLMRIRFGGKEMKLEEKENKRVIDLQLCGKNI